MLAPYLPSSEPGRAGCIRLMGHPPSLGSGGAVAQPWQDSCCPTALQHPQICVWSVLSHTLCPMLQHCPGTLGFPNRPWKALAGPTAAAQPRSLCFLHLREVGASNPPNSRQPLCSVPFQCICPGAEPTSEGHGASWLLEWIVQAKPQHPVKHFGCS